MGTWGAGLYSGDFAADLKSEIAALARLPLSEDELLERLCKHNDAHNDPTDEDHTVFWLVAADQFLKRGILCKRLKEPALAIIDEGKDLSMMEELEMSANDLKKREAVLEELRLRLVATPSEPVKVKKAEKKPQVYSVELGSCYTYPTSKGKAINPYMGGIEENTKRVNWKQDGYGVMIVINQGRAGGILAWHQPLVLATPLREKPTCFSEHLRSSKWCSGTPGTLSRIFFKRMAFEKIDELQFDPKRLRQSIKAYNGDNQAISNISICNSLSYPNLENSVDALEDIFSTKSHAENLK